MIVLVVVSVVVPVVVPVVAPVVVSRKETKTRLDSYFKSTLKPDNTNTKNHTRETKNFKV